MYALKIINIKRGKIRKTIRWAEKIGNNWYMIPRLSNIIYNKSEGIVKTKRQAELLLKEAKEYFDCECEIVRIGFIEIVPDMFL